MICKLATRFAATFFAVVSLLHAESNDLEHSRTDNLPDGPSVTMQQTDSRDKDSRGLKSPSLIYVYPGRITPHRLTAADKWKMYTRDTFGPRSLLTPTIGAAIRLGSQPDRYPDSWQASWGGFGREYGNGLAIQGAQNSAYYAVAGLLHEDPRYAPSTSSNVASRVGHALLFTLIDRNDSGKSRPAFANIAGSVAAGFVGNAYLPDGFNDATHAGQRSIRRLGIYGGVNLLREFTPELMQLGRKFHVRRGGAPIPVWWTPDRSATP